MYNNEGDQKSPQIQVKHIELTSFYWVMGALAAMITAAAVLS